MSENPHIHDSSGNVFEDMGMREAEERLAKAELARMIRREIRERGLSQTKAAALLGVKQPDVSDLVRGKLSRFSIARLERFLNAFDLEVRIQVGCETVTCDSSSLYSPRRAGGSRKPLGLPDHFEEALRVSPARRLPGCVHLLYAIHDITPENAFMELLEERRITHQVQTQGLRTQVGQDADLPYDGTRTSAPWPGADWILASKVSRGASSTSARAT